MSRSRKIRRREAATVAKVTSPKMYAEIYCTLGNTTDGAIEELLKAGMRGARINTAYCDFEDYDRRIAEVRVASEEKNISIPIIMDIKGPQLRISTADPSQSYKVESGIVFPLGYNGDRDKHKDTDIFLNYDLGDALKEGDTLLIENGSIATRVIEKNGETLLQVIDAGDGLIKDSMGVNIPGKYLELPHLTDKDKEVIDYSIRNRLEYLALSYVRDKKDVDYLLNFLEERKQALKINYDIGVCLKIEDKFGLINLEDIITTARRKANLDQEVMVMMGRGDFFNEVNYTKIALAQQAITDYCKNQQIPVMIGTGFLESMKYSSRPTRAEIGDVWNALRDNPDYLMLSAETSNGANPVLAVNVLSRIRDNYYDSQ
ncbi:hypothetical protein H6503_05055 [Candidatus Woesearchaeota archaeon]|nr:hypothetical protein [Candidatus Woesearchaeota archaeon]